MKNKQITERRFNERMSKIYTLIAFALIATLLFAMPFALAEDNETDSVIVPSPDSAETSNVTSTELDAGTVAEINDNLDESVSGLRIGWERVKLGLTFNNEKKAMQELKIARLRLIQARIAAKNNNTEAMQNALEAHNRIMERVKDRVNAIDGASDSEGTRIAAAKLVGLERAIEVHEARISKLNEILASENLTEEQRAKLEEKIAKAEDNTAKLRELEAEKKDKLKTKLRAVANMTEEEAAAEIEEIEDAQNLSAVKKLVSEVKLRHLDSVMEKLRERAAEAQEKGKNISSITIRLENAEKIKEQMQENLKERQQQKAGESE